MKDTLAELISRLFRIGYIPPSCYSFYTAASYSIVMGFMGHLLFFLLFLYLNIQWLAVVNIFSLAIYGACFLLKRKGHLTVMLLLGVVEIYCHAILAVRFTGWNSGFQFFLIMIIPVIFFYPLWSMPIKLILSIFICVTYLSLNLYMRSVLPYVQLGPSVITCLENMNIMLVFLCMIILIFTYSKAVDASQHKLRKANSLLRKMARTDFLTNLPNRKNMLEHLEAEIGRFQRSHMNFTLILCDIDNFKGINDQYGHDCGDYILAQVASVMRNLLRRQDEVARWGGEEFLILLPETDREAGLAVAEKLRNGIADYVFSYSDQQIHVTMTFGVSLYSNKSEGSIEVIKRADRALYRGKENGKNRIAYY